MISDKEEKTGKNKIYNVLIVGPNVRQCGQEKKLCVYLREELSGQRERVPESRNVPVAMRNREEASVGRVEQGEQNYDGDIGHVVP